MISRNRLINNEFAKTLSADGNYMVAKKEAIPAEQQFYAGRNNHTVSRYSSMVSSSVSSAM